MSDDEGLIITSLGFSMLHEISAFFGGIFFASLLLLIQLKDNFLELVKFATVELPISQYIFLAFTMSTCAMIFIFSTLMTGVSGFVYPKLRAEKFAALTILIFGVGTIIMFITIIQILFIIDYSLGIWGLIMIASFLGLLYSLKYIRAYRINDTSSEHGSD